MCTINHLWWLKAESTADHDTVCTVTEYTLQHAALCLGLRVALHSQQQVDTWTPRSRIISLSAVARRTLQDRTSFFSARWGWPPLETTPWKVKYRLAKTRNSVKASVPCKALRRTGWAGRLPAWPLSSWRRACRAWCISCCGGSSGRSWSEPAPGTPGAPEHNRGEENNWAAGFLKLCVYVCGEEGMLCFMSCTCWRLRFNPPSESNLCSQPPQRPSLHQSHRSWPPGQRGSTSSGRCSRPRCAPLCCLHPVRREPEISD